jgi:hypothetical protein
LVISQGVPHITITTGADMKKDKAFIIVLGCVIFVSLVYGDGDKKDGDVEIPPGMELIKEGDVNVVVPKGGKLRKDGGFVLIESAEEYSAREFEKVKEWIAKMGKELESQKKELELLREELKNNQAE